MRHGKTAVFCVAPVLLTMLALAGCACGPETEPTDAVQTARLDVVPTPSPSPLSTPSPTPPPPLAVSFTEDASRPMPGPEEEARHGTSRKLGGTVASNYPLTSVSVKIFCDYNEDPLYPYVQTVTFLPGSGVMRYSLDSDATAEGVSLDSLVRFSELWVGHHSLYVTATTTAGERASELFSTAFDVLNEKWDRLEKSDFNRIYDETLAFFDGDKERFLYRYQRAWDRYTVADPAWEAEYIVPFQALAGEPWLIHRDAVPYYEKALAYLNNTSVRVHGANGDTGVLPLSTLVDAYHGSYVSRFTSGKKYISAHAFGTATDINAAMPPNENTKANKALIDNEVRNLLVYNGIAADGSAPYYDYTYSGGYACTDFAVPETVINYLLYELAFYRAGFQWGHYYNSTSDGMHFTLTDALSGQHDGKDGLRKVYEYYN